MYDSNEIKEIIDKIVFLKKICYDEYEWEIINF